MATEVRDKPLYVVLIEDGENGVYVHSAYFNKEQAVQAAENEKGAKVLTTDLHISYTRL